MNAGVAGLVAVSACATLTAFSPHAIAAEGGQPWQFEFTPYLFAAGLNGTTGVRGITADVEVPVDKLVQQLDSAFMANFEARKENWLFAFDAFYVRLEGQASRSWRGPFGIGSATGNLEVTAKQQIYQPSVGYRVFDDGTTFDIIGAARYMKIDSELDLVVTTGGLLPGGARSLSGSKSWWDPVVGARVTVPFAENWSLVGYADVGGFGVGSDFSYQAAAGVDWQFARSFSAKAGYRYLHQDFEDDGFVWDMALQGFYLGLGIRF
jgi:opacity protein-like surface antigen